MSRRRIGILSAQSEENTQRMFIEGFLKEAFSLDYDVCIFSMYQKYQETPEREKGDSNIYQLVNFDLFDGFVILLDAIQTTGVAEEVQEQLHAYFHGPVLVIDKESSYFPTVMIDHRTPMKKLVDHLIEIHGYRDIVFLNGRPDHIHSVQRLQGYKDSLESHGIPVKEDHIFNGTYWYDSGDAMVDTIMKEWEHLPEAVACANDCMAIGVAKAFEQYGVCIPEDIALVGYDSIEDGRNSPVPLTSADIPAAECGMYAAKRIDAELRNLPAPDFTANPPLFIGGSCGCKVQGRKRPEMLREKWETEISSVSYYSCFNHIMEDLLSQTEYRGFYNTVFQYTYQIRDFDSFHLCLNENWDKPQNVAGEGGIRYGYTNNMCRIMRCGATADSGNSISFDDFFPTTQILPELTQEREQPVAFFFTPLHFDDVCFGYAAISYGSLPRSYSEVYRVWLRSVMQGMEAFNRQAAMRELLAQVEATQIRDALTGLYNYRGFLNQTEELCEAALFEGKSILITAVDMNGLREINDVYGRKAGDSAISLLAQLILETVEPGELCCRMCNDEFIIASMVEVDSKERSESIYQDLLTRCKAYNEAHTDDFQLAICAGCSNEAVSGREALEHLVNDAIIEKNRVKLEWNRRMQAAENLSEEERERDALVQTILDDNRFIYHFQPIVNARTGAIFSYEALMRADVEQRISPPQILESAERLHRLRDVERATFFNVLDYVEKHSDVFREKKVFINSIPGCQLQDEDEKRLQEKLQAYAQQLVVEFTEETEIDDENLAQLKANYQRMHIETAIDDYGSGYSNINNLLRYMPRYVKIDRMLIKDIQDNPQKRHFVKDIIEFAHDNDILALAEGVETGEELKESIRLGADLIQGYYTAKPQAEPLQSINQQIVNEIIQYNQAANKNRSVKQYVMNCSGKLPLVSLVFDKYTQICLEGAGDGSTSKVEVIGAPGFQSNLSIYVADGFKGTLILDEASLADIKQGPAIVLGDHVELSILLKGDSELRNGGICVPETSSLELLGDGNLTIQVNGSKFYGIGNDKEHKHGRLVFHQDGCITIRAQGMTGVGIGAGYGGEIVIEKGRYDLSVNGQDGVCIGAIYEPAKMVIDCCDMYIYYGISNGVVIGSLKESANVLIRNTSARIVGGGNMVVGIGTLSGAECKAEIKSASVTINIRSVECFAMGGPDVKTEFRISYAALKIQLQGKNAFAIGSSSFDALVHSENADLDFVVNNNTGYDIGAKEEDIYIANGRSSFVINGKAKERKVVVADL